MHWSNIEEIAEALEEVYADEEIPENNLSYLREMVLSLHEFEDHEIEVDIEHLKKIMEHWLEVREAKSGS